jgi:hypothetical protein
MEADHKKKAEDLSSASPGSYPPPGTLPNLKLLQRAFGSSAARQRSRTVAYYRIRDRAE